MTTPNSSVFVQTPKKGLVQIAPADTTTAKTVVTAGASGSKVNSLMLTSTDTAAQNVTFGITRSATFYALGTVQVPIKAGQVDLTNPAVNALSSSIAPGLPSDNDGQPYILLQSGDTLDIKSLVTVTTAKVIQAAADYGDF
jgi:hypothetical protein